MDAVALSPLMVVVVTTTDVDGGQFGKIVDDGRSGDVIDGDSSGDSNSVGCGING